MKKPSGFDIDEELELRGATMEKSGNVTPARNTGGQYLRIRVSQTSHQF